MSPEQVRCLPHMVFTYVAHAGSALMRLGLASIADPTASHKQLSEVPGAAILISQAIKAFSAAAADGKPQACTAYGSLLSRLQAGYEDLKKTVGLRPSSAGSASAGHDGSSGGNQALHLLSEVAMGKSGQAELRKGDRSAEAGRCGADALVQRILGVGRAEELVQDNWFDELIQKIS